MYSLAVIIPLFALMVIVAPLSGVSAHGLGKGMTSLTQEQKDALTKAKALIDEGKKDEAQQLIKDAGLPTGRAAMYRYKKGPKEPTEEMKQQHEAVMAAIRSNDFAKFKELTADKPFAGEIDADAFAKLVEAEKLRAAGDEAGARELLKDIVKHDIGKPMKEHKQFKQKVRNGFHKPWSADKTEAAK